VGCLGKSFQAFFVSWLFPMNTSSLQACLSIRSGGMLMRPFFSQHGFLASLRHSSEPLFCDMRHNLRTQIECGFSILFFCIMLHRLSDDSSLSITPCSCRQGSNGKKFDREGQYQWGVWERLSKFFLMFLGFSP